jgi:hypothetical protein
MRARELLDFSARNVAAVSAVAVLVLAATVLVPHWSTRYGAGLAVFTVWMTWFVVTFVRWLADADF